MSSFVSRTNPVTGRVDWVLQDDQYDYHQEVARSAYADMLHDTERNVKYGEALRMAIESLHGAGRRALVLDIGTGTGLLSMFAARYGADSIVACEAFQPMAECARQGIKDNGFEDKIRIIPKRSTQLTVGPEGDMAERANILVTEVFDTELIGEGGLGTFQHALTQLLVPDCIVVPSSAVIYAQVVHSPHLRRWNSLEPIHFCAGAQDSCAGVGESCATRCICAPAAVRACTGSPAVHDLQLDQVSRELFKPITKPVAVLRFDFSGVEPLSLNRDCRLEVRSEGEGLCDAVFMWWVLQMDPAGEVELNTAPRWAHPTPHNMQWRDHWMQAIYYPQTHLSVTRGQVFTLSSRHDEYSLWFDVSQTQPSTNGADHSANDADAEQQPGLGSAPEQDAILWKGERLSRAPACTCGAHIACSRTRIAMLNDGVRNTSYHLALQKIVTESTICLCLGDESLLALFVAKLGAKKVYSVQPNSLSAKLVEGYVEANGLQDRVHVLCKSVDELTMQDFSEQRITLLATEPYFSASSLPWHDLYFLYARTQLAPLLADSCVVFPSSTIIKALAIDLKDLYKIRSDVGVCEGFNLKAFDNLIRRSSDIADGYTESHPLWEYPALPLSDVIDILRLNFTTPLEGVKTLEREGTIQFNGSGSCNGVALWMEYKLDSSPHADTISTGLVAPPAPGSTLAWDPYTRQGVHLFPRPQVIPCGAAAEFRLRHKVTLKPKTGELEFDFAVFHEQLII